MKVVRVTVSLPKPVADAVRSLARKENRSMSGQVGYMLAAGVKK